MKIIKVACFIFIVVLNSCTASKNSVSAKKNITGKWNLETVTIEGNNAVLNEKLLNEAATKCFIGSTWQFMSNGSGTYSLPKTKDCNQLTRKTRWNLIDISDSVKSISLERFDNNNLSLDSGVQHSVIIKNFNSNTMVLSSDATYENNRVIILYNFVRK